MQIAFQTLGPRDAPHDFFMVPDDGCPTSRCVMVGGHRARKRYMGMFYNLLKNCIIFIDEPFAGYILLCDSRYQGCHLRRGSKNAARNACGEERTYHLYGGSLFH